MSLPLMQSTDCVFSPDLVADSNPGIRELPAELGQLSNLWQLDTEDLNITNVPQEIRKEGTVQLSLKILKSTDSSRSRPAGACCTKAH